MNTQSTGAEGRVDYTGRMGPLFSATKPAEWPMYSYERPARLFWNGVANFLREHGMSDEQIKAELGHKNMRWMLDSRDARVERFGYEVAREYFGDAYSAEAPR